MEKKFFNKFTEISGKIRINFREISELTTLLASYIVDRLWIMVFGRAAERSEVRHLILISESPPVI